MSNQTFAPIVSAKHGGSTSLLRVLPAPDGSDVEPEQAASPLNSTTPSFSRPQKAHSSMAPHHDIGGLASFLFEWPTTFQALLDLSWAKLLAGYVLFTTCMNIVLASAYLLVCRSCGSTSCDFIGALYFAVVTLSGNGSYTGEDPIMLTWRTSCFPLRANLVFLFGMMGTGIVSLGAALIVGKAARFTKLGDRLCIAKTAVVHRLFSDIKAPLLFQVRLANVHQRPLFNVSVSLSAVWLRNAADTEASFVGVFSATAVNTEQLHVSCLEERIHTGTQQPVAVNKQIASGSKSDARMSSIEQTLRSQQESPIPLPCNMWYPITITHWVEDPSSPVSRLIAAEGGLSEAMANGLQFVLQVTGQDPLNGANIVVRKAFTKENTLFGYCYSADRALIRSVRGTGGNPRSIYIDLQHLNAVDALPDPEHKGLLGSTASPSCPAAL